MTLNNKGQNKFVIYILIILLVASFGVLSYRLLNSYNNKNEEEESFFQGIFNKIYDTFDKIYNTFDNVDDTFDIDDVDDVFDKADDIISGQDKDSFNRDFEFYQGTQYGSRVRSQIDRVITNNNKNSDHLIEVIFDGNSYGTDPDSIRDIKKELKDFSDNGHGFQYYEIALYYDDNGYVYKITIETV